LRQKTSRQYYARSNIAQALRGASEELAHAIELSEKPPESSLIDSLKKVSEQVNSAIEAERIYILGRKRLAAKLAREKKVLDQLLREVVAMPVLPDEKAVAKRRKAQR